MNWKSRLLYPQNWNIGFCEQTPEELMRVKKLSKVRWLKHPYRDRWFADPFIYKVTETEIVVFVEECMISDTPKGVIYELVIDRKTMHLKERHVMLELDTHLSYPAIVEKDGVTYVYPENGASGSLKMYRYEKEKHQLVDPKCILNGAVADSTILERDGKYYLIATKSENPLEDAYLYKSSDLFGPYSKVTENSVQKSHECSRPAGNWIEEEGELFRPAQDCSVRYGGGISMMKVGALEPFDEKRDLSIEPIWYKYNLGIHTINFSKDRYMIVVDGYGCLNPTISRIWNIMSRIKLFLKK